MSDTPEHLGPGAPITIEGMLDALFAKVMSSETDPGGISRATPEHISILSTGVPTDGLEVLLVLNWVTKSKVEIGRPALDATDADPLLGTLEGPDETTLYRVSIEDMYGRPYRLSTNKEEEIIEAPQVNYDIYVGAITLWGVIEDEDGEEAVVRSRNKFGSEGYNSFAHVIIDATDLPTLVADFELSPANFFSDGDH